MAGIFQAARQAIMSPLDDRNKTYAFQVSGRVQGVFFRASCKGVADRHGLTGWVRNRRDGDVEGIVSGPPAALDVFREWLKQGPEMARVLNCSFIEAEAQDFDGFKIR